MVADAQLKPKAKKRLLPYLISPKRPKRKKKTLAELEGQKPNGGSHGLQYGRMSDYITRPSLNRPFE
jgi:hypothetical protein